MGASYVTRAIQLQQAAPTPLAGQGQAYGGREMLGVPVGAAST